MDVDFIYMYNVLRVKQTVTIHSITIVVIDEPSDISYSVMFKY